MARETILSRLGLVAAKPDTLETRIADLQREISRIGSRLGRQAEGRAGEWSEQVSEFGQDAVRRGLHLAEIAGDEARRSAAALRRDPLPAIATLGTIVLLARLFTRR